MNRSHNRDSRVRRWWGPAVFLVLGAWLLRLYHLGEQSLWFDEGWSWHLGRMSLGEMALTTAGDRSPPLYYALLHAWLALAGQSEFAMRAISAMADTSTAALVMALARALSHRRGPAFIAGLIYACAPFAVWYAQETRMYALVAALCTGSSYWLWRWLRDAQPRSARHVTDASSPPHFATPNVPLLISAGLLALAIYCHYYAIFLLPAHLLVVLATAALVAARSGRSALRFALDLSMKWLVAAACVIVSLVPWLLIASAGFAYDDGFFFPLNTIDGRMLEWARSFAAGGMPRPPPDLWPWLLGSACGLGTAGFLSQRRRHPLAVVLILIIGPLLAATVAVRVVYPHRSVFHPRYLIYLTPMMCVLFGGAGGLAAGQRLGAPSQALAAAMRLTPLALVGALWLPVLHGYFSNPALARDDTRAAVRHVVEALEPGDMVIMSRDNFAVTYYWPRDRAQALTAMPAGLHGILRSDDVVVAALNAARPERVRLMLWQDDVVDPQRFVESTLWPNGYEIGEYNFAQIRLPLYRIERHPITRIPFIDAHIVFHDAHGEQLHLKRFWHRPEGVAGDWFYAVFEWETPRALATDYKVFVHVLDHNGRLTFQSDRQPLNALLPMSRWTPGESMRDAHAMVIPAELHAGSYRVVVGVYDPVTGQRLIARHGDDALGTFAPVGRVEVKQP